MLTLLKVLQSLVRALNSDGTPGQVAAGLALGAALGLTPLVNLHNLIIVAAIALLNVSVPGALLGWLLAVPFGFALDPLFDGLGEVLLIDVGLLEPLWRVIGGTPVLALTNLTNSVTLGSLLAWMLLAFPLYLLARLGVGRYRATIYPRIAGWKVFKAMRASKLYTLYRILQP